VPAGAAPKRILKHQQTAEIGEAKARDTKTGEAAAFAEYRHDFLDARNLSEEGIFREKVRGIIFAFRAAHLFARALWPQFLRRL
jgi:hypothetical protein